MILTNILSLYLILMSLTGLFWGIRIRTLNGSNYSRAMLLLSFAVCIYTLGYAMELNSTTVQQILFWNYIEYIGIPFVSALWLTTALMYTGHFSRHRKLLLVLIFTIPIITFILRPTNFFHWLYFSSVSFLHEDGRLVLVKNEGIWSFVQAFHSMTMIIASMVLFVADALRSKEKYIGKIVLTIFGSVVAVGGLIAILLNPFDFHIDYMALSLPLTCAFIILAISRYDLLETKSIARSKAFESSNDAILLTNRLNKVLDYNTGAKKLFECLNIRMNAGYISDLFSDIPTLAEALGKTEMSVVELDVGENKLFEIFTQSIEDHGTPRGWIKTISDVTEIHKLNDELKKQASVDELSGLFNRRAFTQKAQEIIAQTEESGESLYLLMMDLDHFKNVNDQYGHPAGDLVIKGFGALLRSHFGDKKLIARLGGEEFAVVEKGLTDEEVNLTIDSFIEKVRKFEYSYRNKAFSITVSLGVTQHQSGQALESIMRKADKALYQSKDNGRDRATFI